MLHQTGGVAYLGHVAADGFHFEIVEISATEHDSRTRRRGQDTKIGVRSAVQPNSAASDRGANCSFEDQRRKNCIAELTDYNLRDSPVCGIYTTVVVLPHQHKYKAIKRLFAIYCGLEHSTQ